MIDVGAYIFCMYQISLFKISVGTLEIPVRLQRDIKLPNFSRINRKKVIIFRENKNLEAELAAEVNYYLRNRFILPSC